MISQSEVSKTVKLIETERRMVVCQELEGGEWEVAVQWAQSFSYVRWINSKDMLYNFVPTIKIMCCALKVLLSG